MLGRPSGEPIVIVFQLTAELAVHFLNIVVQRFAFIVWVLDAAFVEGRADFDLYNPQQCDRPIHIAVGVSADPQINSLRSDKSLRLDLKLQCADVELAWFKPV